MSVGGVLYCKMNFFFLSSPCWFKLVTVGSLFQAYLKYSTTWKKIPYETYIVRHNYQNSLQSNVTTSMELGSNDRTHVLS